MHQYTHIPVLLEESIQALTPRPHGTYIDCTLGLGGHTEYILQRTQGLARIIAFDRDSEALSYAKQRLAPYGTAVTYYHLPFSSLPTVLEQEGITSVDGILLDAGISSMQLDNASRGFSFQSHAPLDMRMDTHTGRTVQELLACISFESLYNILHIYGEEPLAKKIARAIIRYREQQPIIYTSQLASIVENTYPTHWRRTARTHPATRTFQALRIYINDELQELSTLIDSAIPYLAIGATIAIISFHSLEDRIVKHSFKRYTRTCVCPPEVLRCVCNHKASLQILTKKPILPGEHERQQNPRARSAKLRIARKVYHEIQ